MTWLLIITMSITLLPEYEATLTVRGPPSEWACKMAAISAKGLNGATITIGQSECLEDVKREVAVE